VNTSKNFLVRSFSEIDDRIINTSSDINELIQESKKEQIDIISTYYTDLNQLIEKSVNLINDAINIESERIRKSIEKQGESTNEQFIKLLNEFNGLKESSLQKYEQLSEELTNKAEKICKLGENTIVTITKDNELTRLSSGKAVEAVKEEIISHADSIKNLTDEAAKVFLSTLQDNLNSISTMISDKSDHISSSLFSVNEGLLERLSHSEGELTETINSIVADAIESFKQRINSLSQENSVTLDSVVLSSKMLAAKSDSLIEKFGITSEFIVNQIKQNNEDYKNHVETSVSHMESSIEKIKRSSEESHEQLMKSSVAQSNFILKEICSLSTKTATIEESIEASTGTIQKETETLNERLNVTREKIDDKLSILESAINQGTDSIITDAILPLTEKVISYSEHIEEMTNKLNDSNKEHFVSLEDTLHSIQDQNSSVTKLISNSIKESDKATELFLHQIDEQYDTLNKGLGAMQIRTKNIEDSVTSLIEKDDKEQLIDSFKTIIIEVKSLIGNAVSEINNNFLDSHIYQETINNELAKLQVLLRTTLVSIDRNKQQEQNNNPNRTESIIDKETGNTVLNQIKNGKVVKSTMKNAKGSVIYELEYVDDKIVRSRNFDAKGKINIEQTYYDNGQVHFRNEFTTSGKITTEFDINGKKK
jgi:DNA-binding ferritin-like protein